MRHKPDWGECDECGYQYLNLASLDPDEIINLLRGIPDCETCNRVLVWWGLMYITPSWVERL